MLLKSHGWKKKLKISYGKKKNEQFDTHNKQSQNEMNPKLRMLKSAINLKVQYLSYFWGWFKKKGWYT